MSASSDEEPPKSLTRNDYSCEFTPMPDPESSESLTSSEQTRAEDPTVVQQLIGALRSLHVKSHALKPTTPLSAFDLEGIAQYIKDRDVKNVVFMCGAGISVNAGIPDFRSPKTGLFSRLRELGLSQPEDVFDIDFFRKDQRPFYRLAKELLPGKYRPTKAHYFMKLLQDQGILLRCYSQNIDSLESQAGIDPEKVIAAHGNFDGARCIYCKRQADMDVLLEHIQKGDVMKCIHCQGPVKPDIVFYGESLPERFFKCAQTDFDQCDLLIIMGSSLVVHPFCLFVDNVGDMVPRLLINKEWATGGFGMAGSGLQRGPTNRRDAFFQGDCDEGVTKLASLMGLEDALEALIAEK